MKTTVLLFIAISSFIIFTKCKNEETDTEDNDVDSINISLILKGWTNSYEENTSDVYDISTERLYGFSIKQIPSGFSL